MVLLVVANRLKALFLVLLAIIKRSLCCLRRRRKSSCDSVPLTAVGIGSASTYEQNTSSNELHSWNAWDDPVSVVSEPTTVQHHIELYRQQQQAARKLSESQNEPTPQTDFFQDMAPKITKQTKILLKTQNEQSDEVSSRLSFAPDAFIPPSGPELGTWEEKEGNEIGSWEEAEGWDTAKILRDKRKAEREHRATLKREHMRSTLGSKLQQYGDSEDEEDTDNDNTSDATMHLAPLEKGKTIASLQQSLAVCAAPTVVPMGSYDPSRYIDVTTNEITKNLKYDELFAPELGPENPFLTQQQKAKKNTLSGYVEQAHMSEFQFENQRRTFTSYGYALDPTVDGKVVEGSSVIGAVETSKETQGKTVFESTSKRPLDKRKRNKNDDPSDIEGFLGPWGTYVDEKRVMKPNEEEAEELEEYLAKKQKRGKQVDDKPLEEKTVLHIKDSLDYQGRSFLHPPQDVGVNLKSDTPPERCFLPKTHIHTWEGHTKGISAIRWFPHSAHLILSCSMDCRVKLWEVYNDRRCIRTYYGHRQAVRDISFNNPGTQFLSAAYDRYIKLWDTETGQCISRFTSRKIPYCVKFNPDDEKQHLFVAGTSDKKIICWDIKSGEIVQEYDRHLGAVNTITFVDENRRFVTTSDDKSLRVWEWDIPVDMKYIADPSMHSMPAVTPSPNQKWLACQSMDNKIVIFSALNRFKLNRKKTFSGHMVAGYACSLDFSPDMSYIMSGDADGKCYIWDWKTTKLYKKWKAHDNVCIGVLWHPHEPSKVATAGWDGLIKYWD